MVQKMKASDVRFARAHVMQSLERSGIRHLSNFSFAMLRRVNQINFQPVGPPCTTMTGHLTLTNVIYSHIIAAEDN